MSPQLLIRWLYEVPVPPALHLKTQRLLSARGTNSVVTSSAPVSFETHTQSASKTSSKSSVSPQTLSSIISQQRTTANPAIKSVGGPSTTTSVSVKTQSITPTSTSTITDHAESTFSSAVVLSTVNPGNGKMTYTTPAVVTVFTTSTKPDGNFVTYTHVIANPTPASDDGATEGRGFLTNHGAVAGVFTVLGIIACAFSFGVVLLCRRRRRHIRQRHWSENLPRQTQSPTPFEDSRSRSPPMKNVREDPGTWISSTRVASTGEADGQFSSDSYPEPSPFVYPFGPTFRRVPVPPIDSDEKTFTNGALGHDIAYNLRDDRIVTTQSSPSIYPASLASLPDDGESTNVFTSATPENPFGAHSPHVPRVSMAPPRPPRSHLRGSATKALEIAYPITPPSSVSSHTPPSSPLPTLDVAQVVNRRTLLDVCALEMPRCTCSQLMLSTGSPSFD
ncbi:hypothetical protein H0H93_002974 [Arthromyces matolae]|nr:hypothetical protein H0H93_002974 [Arthromyces matolae]